jgi:16S rRNA (adenine(1408)-N(1))-methyltransferase
MALHLPQTSPIAASLTEPTGIRQLAGQHERLHIDLGTGDGKYAVQRARQDPGTAVIALDTCLDHLHGAARRHPHNLRFVSHDALSWPIGLFPVASVVTVNFPYGSLLRGLVEGDPGLMNRLDTLLGPGSRLEVRINESALVAGELDPVTAPETIVRALCQVPGLRLARRAMTQVELRAFPSSWAKRLGYGKATTAWLITGYRT